ncbi:sodium-dependent transporter [Nitrosopumilus sp. SJ]|uniref:sodium-dependent transporter n=1 Tax=Nitrosopumilus sp. SJ TaxID=1027374 RepID=UPI000362CE13|nr:sodium-dependent transporter [Nitrosopumilus sp. SJ]
MPEKQSEKWNSGFGFLLACIGSAVGMGNIWRFPYVAGENGGGGFLVPFLIIVASFGFLLMLLEFAIGRKYKSSIVTGMANISKKFRWIGAFIAVVAFSILSFYLVILGWVLSFFVSNLGQSFLDFQQYSQTFFPVVSFVAILFVTYLIINRGIASGIELFNKVGILCLIAILIPLMVYATTLPNADKGIAYFLNPDFSKITEPNTWSIALGQAFFSLSLGSGSLLTYSSYLRGKHSMTRSSGIIIFSNTAISIIAGLMIFSFVFSYRLDPEAGIPLIFEVLPTIFSNIYIGYIIGSVFFFLLLIAGLTSALGMFQVPNASLQDTFKISNKKSSRIVSLGLLAVGLPSALSYSPINLNIFGTPFLDGMDYIFGTYGIVISELLFVVAVTWVVDKTKILEHINTNSSLKIPESAISFIKFGAPVASIVVILTSMFV